MTPYTPKEHPSADGLTIPLVEREARFVFVVKRVIAVLPLDFEQVYVFDFKIKIFGFDCKNVTTQVSILMLTEGGSTHGGIRLSWRVSRDGGDALRSRSVYHPPQ